MPSLLGTKLRYLRMAHGFSTRDLAHKMGMYDNTIFSKWENNHRFPSKGTLEKLANLYKLSKNYLLNQLLDNGIISNFLPEVENDNTETIEVYTKVGNLCRDGVFAHSRLIS